MDKEKLFLWKDWKPPIIVGLIMSCLIAVLLWFDNDSHGSLLLARDIAELSASFSFTFIGVLLTFYSILQVLTDKEWVKERVVDTRYWKIFKKNLIRQAKLLVVLFFVSILYKGVDYTIMSNLPDIHSVLVPAFFTLIMCFLMSVTLVRIYMTACTFIEIVTADDRGVNSKDLR